MMAEEKSQSAEADSLQARVKTIVELIPIGAASNAQTALMEYISAIERQAYARGLSVREQTAATAAAIAGRLRQAATTAQNDDITIPSSTARQRHTTRVDAMIEAAEYLEGMQRDQ